MVPQLEIVHADLARPEHCDAVLAMTDHYSRHPMGAGAPLADVSRDRLIGGLREANAIVFLAFSGGEPIGIATCFRGFSTFAARPLINVHDLCVHEAYRGAGIGRQLLTAVANHAAAKGHCKVTLEVAAENEPARRLYSQMGFAGAASDDEQMLFCSRVVSRDPV